MLVAVRDGHRELLDHRPRLELGQPSTVPDGVIERAVEPVHHDERPPARGLYGRSHLRDPRLRVVVKEVEHSAFAPEKVRELLGLDNTGWKQKKERLVRTTEEGGEGGDGPCENWGGPTQCMVIKMLNVHGRSTERVERAGRRPQGTTQRFPPQVNVSIQTFAAPAARPPARQPQSPIIARMHPRTPPGRSHDVDVRSGRRDGASARGKTRAC